MGRWGAGLRLADRSRRSREVHVRIGEGVGVRFPRAPRLLRGLLGPRAEAKASKDRSPTLLGTARHLTFAAAKPLRTPAKTGRASLLGSAIGLRACPTK